MGFAEKPLQVGGGGGGVESDVKKWVIAGIPLRSPLKPIVTKAAPHQKEIEEESRSTPTSKESRIPTRLVCPPPPCRKKPKPKPKPKPSSGVESSSSSCEYYMGNSSSSSSGGGGGVIREFFTPPHDFENLFTRRTYVRT